MDVYQWTLAARQDLDSYLAISATSLPYNLAHAIGNVVFCLLIGPAFIRALRRYRRRFEVRWRAPVRRCRGELLLALAWRAAAPPPPRRVAGRQRRALALRERRTATAASAARRGPGLERALQRLGALGLAAAGHNPRDVRRHGALAGRLRARACARARDIGEVERTVLVLEAAGLSARASAGATCSARSPAAAGATARSRAT